LGVAEIVSFNSAGHANNKKRNEHKRRFDVVSVIRNLCCGLLQGSEKTKKQQHIF
jgi:hypothetical protein